MVVEIDPEQPVAGHSNVLTEDRLRKTAELGGGRGALRAHSFVATTWLGVAESRLLTTTGVFDPARTHHPDPLHVARTAREPIAPHE
jgi:hypothetical protein